MVKRVLGQLGFPVEVRGRACGHVALAGGGAFRTAVPLELFHDHAALFVEGHSLCGEHPPLLVGASEGETGGHASVLENDAVARDAARIGARLGVGVQGVADVARRARGADEPRHLAVGGHLSARYAPHDGEHSVGIVSHEISFGALFADCGHHSRWKRKIRRFCREKCDCASPKLSKTRSIVKKSAQ